MGSPLILRQRQIHLDFHTPGTIDLVGQDFDPEAFASAMKDAHVDSVTVFSRCHHGYTYHPTSIGTMHPGLSFDLLGMQIDALRRAGIRSPIYITVGWDELAADQHPEWLQRNDDGSVCRNRPDDESSWRFLDFASPYVDHVLALTREVIERYSPIDGIFFDIVRQCRGAVLSPWLSDSGPIEGESVAQHQARVTLDVERTFLERAYNLVKASAPDATVFFNSRLRPDRVPELGSRAELPWYSHVEIESLPGGEWGYNHYPLFAGYFQSLGHPLLGMTGVFHTSWGDFGSVKTQAALDFECSRMVATGAACSIGDHLHPNGKLDRAAYTVIGNTYGRLEALEPWTSATTPIADIGILLAETGARFNVQGRDSDEGAMRMMLEQHRLFQFIDSAAALNQFKLIIAPDSVPFGPDLSLKLKRYLAGGGSLLLTHRSGLTPVGDAFAPELTEELGIEYAGPSSFSPDFLVVDGDPGRALDQHGQVLYERGSQIVARDGSDVLARVGVPYFTRSPEIFYGHQQSPMREVTSEPSIVRKGKVVYCHSPLFAGYRLHGVPAYRDIVDSLIDALVDQPSIRTAGLPTTAEVYALTQPEHGDRVIVHVLHAIPQRRGKDIDIIEDVLSIHDVRIGLESPRNVRRATLVPSGAALPLEETEGVAWVTIPRVDGHQVVVFE